jgi:hypothetical protein
MEHGARRTNWQASGHLLWEDSDTVSGSCLVLIDGLFQPSSDQTYKPLSDAVAKRMKPWFRALRLVDVPRIYAELAIEPAADLEAVQIRPLRLDISEAPCGIDGDETLLHGSLFLTLWADGAEIGTAAITLPRLRYEVAWESEDLIGHQSLWLDLPTPAFRSAKPDTGTRLSALAVLNETLRAAKADFLVALTNGSSRRPMPHQILVIEPESTPERGTEPCGDDPPPAPEQGDEANEQEAEEALNESIPDSSGHGT